MKERKNKKASKTNAPKAKPAVQQLSFLPSTPVYPPELAAAMADLVRVGEAVWLRVDRIVNPPDASMNRYDAKEWRAQLHSFQTLGIKSAVHVRSVEGGYWLEDGRHRILGARELGLAYVKADIDGAGTAGTSAVWRLEANAKRKGDRPIDQANTFREMMDSTGAAMTQKQVAEFVGVSQATVSRRLRLLDLPRDLAVLVGDALDDSWLEPVFSVRDDAALLESATAAVLKAAKAGDVRDADDVAQAMQDAWDAGKLAIPAEHDAFTYEVVEDLAWAKALPGLGVFKVKVPSRFEDEKAREVVFYRNVELAIKSAQEIHERLEEDRRAAEAKLAAKAAKQGKKVKTLPDGTEHVVETPQRRSVQERVPEQRTKVQLDLMARHLPAQLSWPEEMMAEVLARFVAHTGSLTAEQDMAAACRVLGVPMPEKRPNSLRSVRLSREDFLARWKKDQAEALRLVAVALFFQARDYHKQLGDPVNHEVRYGSKSEVEPRLATWLTGRTFEEATAVAKQAIKDRDAGFKAVVDGALCDHCDAAASLRKGGVNVCRSEFFRDVDVKTLAVRRLRRAEAAKTAGVGSRVVDLATTSPAEPAQPQETALTGEAPAEAPAEGLPVEVASGEEPGVASAKPELFKRRGRKAKTAADS